MSDAESKGRGSETDQPQCDAIVTSFGGQLECQFARPHEGPHSYEAELRPAEASTVQEAPSFLECPDPFGPRYHYTGPGTCAECGSEKGEHRPKWVYDQPAAVAQRPASAQPECRHSVSVDTLPPFCGTCGAVDPWSRPAAADNQASLRDHAAGLSSISEAAFGASDHPPPAGVSRQAGTTPAPRSAPPCPQCNGVGYVDKERSILCEFCEDDPSLAAAKWAESPAWLQEEAFAFLGNQAKDEDVYRLATFLTRIVGKAELRRASASTCICAPDCQEECCPQHGRFATLQDAWNAGREHERVMTAPGCRVTSNASTAEACAFCHKTTSDVRQMVQAWPETPVRICDECIGLCNELLGTGSATPFKNGDRVRWGDAPQLGTVVDDHLTVYVQWDGSPVTSAHDAGNIKLATPKASLDTGPSAEMATAAIRGSYPHGSTTAGERATSEAPPGYTRVAANYLVCNHCVQTNHCACFGGQCRCDCEEAAERATGEASLDVTCPDCNGFGRDCKRCDGTGRRRERDQPCGSSTPGFSSPGSPSSGFGSSSESPAAGPKAKASAAEIRARLREHYLTGIECDHEAKTDRASCSCSRVLFPALPSVGAAVESWIDHVLGPTAECSTPCKAGAEAAAPSSSKADPADALISLTDAEWAIYQRAERLTVEACIQALRDLHSQGCLELSERSWSLSDVEGQLRGSARQFTSPAAKEK